MLVLIRRFSRAVGMLTLTALTLPVAAAFPERPITIIVPGAVQAETLRWQTTVPAINLALE